MGKGNFTEEFKRDAVRQNTERGYPVAEVSQRLGQPAFALCVEEDVFDFERQGQRRGRGDQAAQARAGPCYRGTRHPKERGRVRRRR